MSGPEFHEVEEVEGIYAPRDWPWAEAERAALDAHWAKLAAGNDALFDGPVLLAHRWGVRDRRFEAAYFPTRYSRFIGWRDLGFADASVANCFAMAALQGADGAFILGEMGAATSNAGKIYFPAGTPDPKDVGGARVDLAASALRELEEETGLTGADYAVAPRWTVLKLGQRIACLRPIRCHLPAEAVVAQIHAALERQEERELSRMHVVRSRAEIDPARMPAFIVAFLERALAR